MEVSRPDLVSRPVSRPAFAGLGLLPVSDLEILVSVLCSYKVSVSLVETTETSKYYDIILKLAKCGPTISIKVKIQAESPPKIRIMVCFPVRMESLFRVRYVSKICRYDCLQYLRELLAFYPYWALVKCEVLVSVLISD